MSGEKMLSAKIMIDRTVRLLFAAAVLGAVMLSAAVPAAAEAGFIGMQVQGMSPRVSAALGLKNAKGVLVRDIALQGPAARAGFLRGDLITSFNGKEVSSFSHLVKMVQTIKPGQDVSIKVLRLGRKMTLILKAGTWVNSWKVKKGSFATIPDRGLTLAALTQKVRQRFGIRWGATGVVITLLDKSKTRNMDLQRGEIIRQVNQREVWLPRQVQDMYLEARRNKRPSLLLLVEGVSGFRFSILRLPAASAAAK